MADVDFSHAVLDVRTDISTVNPMNGTYVYLDISQSLFDANSNAVASIASKSIITNTPTKVSILLTGTFSASGTAFYMGDHNGGANNRPWKVSNISFSSGDTYSFIIDIETSGNT